MKLRRRLVLYIFPVAAASVISMQMITTRYIDREVKKSIENQVNNTAIFVSRLTTNLISSAKTEMQILGALEMFSDFVHYRNYGLKEEAHLKRSEIEKVFRKILAERPEYLRIQFQPPKKSDAISIESPIRPRGEDIPATWMPGDQLTYPFKYGQDIELTDAFPDRTFNEKAIRFKFNLSNDGHKLGAVFVDISLAQLFHAITALHLNNNSKISIVNREGRPLVSTLDEAEVRSSVEDRISSKSAEIPVLQWRVSLITRVGAFQALGNEIREKTYLVLFLLFVGLAIVLTLLARKLSHPAEKIVALLQANHILDNNNKSRFSDELRRSGYEFENIASSVDSLLLRINEYYERAMKATHFESKAQIASQVAHDIRSPLTALEVATSDSDLSLLPESKRVLIRESARRIKDIANNLLVEHGGAQTNSNTSSSPAGVVDPGEATRIELLSSLVESLCSEKRLQLRSRLGLSIDTELDKDSYGLFAAIQPQQFKRALSNLLNNAAEAISDRGKVSVTLSSTRTEVVLRISDNGKGIPKDVLGRIAQRGVTHGKDGGQGLGLYFSRMSLEAWGGRLLVSSEPGKGTVVECFLPKVTPPAWFVPELRLARGTGVVVLDDDTSIHQIWKNRFSALRASNQDVRLIHFSTSADLEAWHQNQANLVDFSTLVYLFDFELLGERRTGLDVVADLGLSGKVALVTSRFEEKEVRTRCEQLNVRLIPKGLAGHVPIILNEKARPDAVLIDNDDLIQMTWKISAEKSAKEVRVFSDASAFFIHSEHLERTTPIYVDSQLGNNVKGEDVARRIFELGFQDVYLATGLASGTFDRSAIPWVKDVLGKTPPWESGQSWT